MFRFIIKKIAYGFFVLFGVVTVIFILFNIKPGDPALMLGGQHSTKEIVQTIRKDLGLDLPFHKRYAFYLNDLSPISIHNVKELESVIYLDSSKYTAVELLNLSSNKSLVLKYPYLRKSYQNKRSVAQIIREKLPDTFVLALSAILIATVLGIIFGVISAVNKGRFFDNISFIAAVSGMSAPSFFMAAIISVVGGYTWSNQMDLPVLPFVFSLLAIIIGLLTILVKKNKSIKFKTIVTWSIKGFIIGAGFWLVYIGFYSIFSLSDWPIISSTFPFPGTGLDPNGSLVELNDYTGDEEYHWENLILPAITLGIRPLAIVIQLTRSSLLDELSQDYIRTARSKGLSKYKVIVNHALINSLNPVITAISGWFASLLAGAVFVEQIFDWNGIGNELVSALKNDDFPLVIGVTIVVACFFVLINIIVDIVYGYLDPRVRLN
ncbi:MAG: ABC transporter permease [Flavobacteriales bacterium]|nr:ABC transporter permease [Flavobacteriales bacterium]